MIISLKEGITPEQYNSVLDRIKSKGLEPHIDEGSYMTIIGIRGDTRKIEDNYFMIEGVKSVKRVSKRYKEVSREFKSTDTIVDIGGVRLGNGYFNVIAGPCSVESREQLFESAEKVKISGATLLRGGAFKPRSSPYEFQGLEEKGLELLVEAREKFGLPIVTEIMDIRDLELFKNYDIDMYQVGARNMQNFNLLKELGHINKPVLLKRGLSGLIEEWLLSAEYILANGNSNVVLCERGIRTFETAYRNVLDLNCVPYLKQITHLPIIVDPSHATGNIDLIPSMSLAAVAAGSHGLILEVHPNRKQALSDSNQQLSPEEFYSLMKKINSIRSII